MERAGATVIKYTERQTYQGTPFWNGKRRVLIEVGDKHVERQQVFVDKEGKSHDWFLTYRGQPFNCRKCDEMRHEDGQCPRWEDRSKQNHEGTEKFVFFSNSILKRATDTKDIRFDVIPGAKVGHLANHINNDANVLPKADIVVVNPGNNMSMENFDDMKAHAVAQSTELSKVLGAFSGVGKEIFLVDPCLGPLPEDGSADQSRFMRQEMKRCAARSAASFIPLDHLEMTEDDMDTDGVHLSVSGTRLLLNNINSFIQQKTGIDILGPNFVIQEREYGAVKRHHWKVGCPRCTIVHPTRECPPPNVTINAIPGLISGATASGASSSIDTTSGVTSGAPLDAIASAIATTTPSSYANLAGGSLAAATTSNAISSALSANPQGGSLAAASAYAPVSASDPPSAITAGGSFAALCDLASTSASNADFKGGSLAAASAFTSAPNTTTSASVFSPEATKTTTTTKKKKLSSEKKRAKKVRQQQRQQEQGQQKQQQQHETSQDDESDLEDEDEILLRITSPGELVSVSPLPSPLPSPMLLPFTNAGASSLGASPNLATAAAAAPTTPYATPSATPLLPSRHAASMPAPPAAPPAPASSSSSSSSAPVAAPPVSSSSSLSSSSSYRSRSSTKRTAEEERSRSESLKRQKSNPAQNEVIKKNMETLKQLGVPERDLYAKYRGLEGDVILTKQKEDIAYYRKKKGGQK